MEKRAEKKSCKEGRKQKEKEKEKKFTKNPNSTIMMSNIQIIKEAMFTIRNKKGIAIF